MAAKSLEETMPVVTEKPIRGQELRPVDEQLGFYEGFVDEQRYLVPKRNLEAMRDMINFTMRRRVSLRYRHQTSDEVMEYHRMQHLLNILLQKIDKAITKEESLSDKVVSRKEDTESSLSPHNSEDNKSKVVIDVEDKLQLGSNENIPLESGQDKEKPTTEVIESASLDADKQTPKIEDSKADFDDEVKNDKKQLSSNGKIKLQLQQNKEKPMTKVTENASLDADGQTPKIEDSKVDFDDEAKNDKKQLSSNGKIPLELKQHKEKPMTKVTENASLDTDEQTPKIEDSKADLDDKAKNGKKQLSSNGKIPLELKQHKKKPMPKVIENASLDADEQTLKIEDNKADFDEEAKNDKKQLSSKGKIPLELEQNKEKLIPNVTEGFSLGVNKQTHQRKCTSSFEYSEQIKPIKSDDPKNPHDLSDIDPYQLYKQHVSKDENENKIVSTASEQETEESEKEKNAKRPLNPDCREKEVETKEQERRNGPREYKYREEETDEYRVRFMVSGHFQSGDAPMFIIHEYEAESGIFENQVVGIKRTKNVGDVNIKIAGHFLRENIIEKVSDERLYLKVKSQKIEIDDFHSKIFYDHFEKTFKIENFVDILLKGAFLTCELTNDITPMLSVSIKKCSDGLLNRSTPQLFNSNTHLTTIYSNLPVIPLAEKSSLSKYKIDVIEVSSESEESNHSSSFEKVVKQNENGIKYNLNKNSTMISVGSANEPHAEYICNIKDYRPVKKWWFNLF